MEMRAGASLEVKLIVLKCEVDRRQREVVSRAREDRSSRNSRNYSNMCIPLQRHDLNSLPTPSIAPPLHILLQLPFMASLD